MPGFTPGPWHYRPNEHDDWGFVRASPDCPDLPGGIICQARDPAALDEATLSEHRKAGTDPWEANARLIAAVPDLYDVVERLVSGSTALVPLCAMARDALRKATGEA
jgi:hypothetical protein